MNIKRLTLALTLGLGLTLSFSSLAQEKAWLKDILWSSDYLTFYGNAYFNVTRSGVQGEQYLLNQQLSTIKLFSDLTLTRWSKIHGAFVYNSAPTPINSEFYFEELFLSLANNDAPLHAKFGRQWVPFGIYKNDLIYKPMTKALGQTNEYAIELGYDQHYYANTAFFIPESRIISSSLPLYYTATVGVHDERQPQRYDIGISYLYSIAESQLFQYNKGFGGFLWKKIHSHVPGIASYANVNYYQFNTNLSYVTALNAFQPNEISYENAGAKPMAISIQEGYTFKIKDVPTKFIVFYDRTFEALALRLPERRLGVGLNVNPHPYLEIQFQFSKDSNYSSRTISSGLNNIVKGSSETTNTAALQFTLNF